MFSSKIKCFSTVHKAPIQNDDDDDDDDIEPRAQKTASFGYRVGKLF